MGKFQRVAVFCGSSSGHDPVYAEAARATGAYLAAEGVEVIYGGGRVGIMGLVADAALAAGGRVTGVIPEFMMAKERGHTGVTELIRTDSMHSRKAIMAERAEAFLALPGGFGTLDELFEILTWAQLRLHRKPVGLLNVNGFFDPLLAMVEHAAREGFVAERHRARLHSGESLAELLARMGT